MSRDRGEPRLRNRCYTCTTLEKRIEPQRFVEPLAGGSEERRVANLVRGERSPRRKRLAIERRAADADEMRRSLFAQSEEHLRRMPRLF